MRVSADSTSVDLTPGSSADIVLDVINTGAVIDGITARVVGLPERQVTTKPPVLALFPDSAGRMTVNVGLPAAFPAGRHPLTVEVHSRQDGTGPEYLDLDLLVPPTSAFELISRPKVVRAHRTARFVITVANQGNIALEVSLSAVDPEKALGFTFDVQRLTVEPGRARDVVLEVRGPRMILGSEIDRPSTVTATARSTAILPGPAPVPGQLEAGPNSLPADLLPPAELPGTEELDAGVDPAEQTLIVTLRQRPWLTKGLLTALILVAIIAIWAGIFLFGLSAVFGQDPATKSAPPSFFVGDVALVAETQDANSTRGDITGPQVAAPQAAVGEIADPAATTEPEPGGAPGTAAQPDQPAAPPTPPVPGPPPPDALPKDGSMPPGLGGTIAGTVRAASSGEPVGRILVDALRPAKDGSLQVAGSAATQADGSYQVAGLFPTGYVLRFSADGFDPIYYPAAPVDTGATQVPATVGAVTRGMDVVINGKPASITGTVDPGDTLTPVVTTITVRATQGAQAGQDVTTTTTDGAGAYSLGNLPAPAVYELSFTADGYQPSVVTTSVDGGASRIQPSVLLTAGNGEISGTVTDGSAPLGGMTVSTTVAGTALTSGTPTTGDVGHFVLGNLPTPATYVLTVSGPGYGGTTVVVDLGPGERKTDLTVSLASGTGVLSGTLVDSAGAGIGGARVTVGGMTNPPTTDTLTAGTVGAFTLAGLPSGGALTLTFSHEGYAETTVPVQPGSTTPLTVTMSASQGEITGQVSGPNGPIAGATVTATDGKRSWPVTSTASSPGTAAGGYVISQLPAGAYTVTATADGQLPRTALVTVTAGASATADFALTGDG